MKNLWITASILLSVLVFFSCEKETMVEPTKEVTTTTPTQLSINDVKSEDGILIFDSWEHLNEVNTVLRDKGYEAELQFGEKHNFTSQNVILQEVMLAEERIEEEYITANNGNYEGLRIPKSQAYQDALQKGLLNVEEDSDTAHTYYLSVLNPTISRLMNEEGFVMVGTELWQHTNTQIKFCKDCTIKDKELLARATITNDDETIVTFTKNRNSRLINDWSNYQPAWQEFGYKRGRNRKRARYNRIGWSEKSDNCQTCFINCTYYLNNQAQTYEWGKWKFRNSYMPRFKWDGTWGGYGYIWDVSVGSSYFIPISALGIQVGVTNTPMTNRLYNGNNNTAVTLHPHRNGGIPAPNYQDYWSTPLMAKNISIDGELVDNFNNLIIDLDD
jgi:hypothetical protein